MIWTRPRAAPRSRRNARTRDTGDERIEVRRGRDGYGEAGEAASVESSVPVPTIAAAVSARHIYVYPTLGIHTEDELAARRHVAEQAAGGAGSPE